MYLCESKLKQKHKTDKYEKKEEEKTVRTSKLCSVRGRTCYFGVRLFLKIRKQIERDTTALCYFCCLCARTTFDFTITEQRLGGQDRKKEEEEEETPKPKPKQRKNISLSLPLNTCVSFQSQVLGNSDRCEPHSSTHANSFRFVLLMEIQMRFGLFLKRKQ